MKMLGTNGGGFYGMNSAHPFENPNAAFKFLKDFLDDGSHGLCVYVWAYVEEAASFPVIFSVMFLLSRHYFVDNLFRHPQA